MTTHIEPIVSIRDLTKEYGNTRAIDGLTLNIMPGQVVGLLGPNGSGKTTLLKHIIGLLKPSRGHVLTFGSEALSLDGERMARIGYVSQDNDLIDWLTVDETLGLARGHHPTWDAEMESTLIEKFQLQPNRKCGGLSLGQKQRLSVVLGVCHKPQLLLLDEPAASLDPVVRQDFLNLLMDMVQDGERTVLISSHILTDVQKVIDQVLIMDHGQMHCFQPLDSLREEYHRIDLSALRGDLPAEIRFTGLKYIEGDAKSAMVTVHNPDADQVEQEAEALGCRHSIRNLDFEEIYRLVVTGK